MGATYWISNGHCLLLLCRFRVRRNTVFSKVYAAYAKQKQIQEDSILFVYDGQRIQKDSTPESLDMEDGDVVDCQVCLNVFMTLCLICQGTHFHQRA